MMSATRAAGAALLGLTIPLSGFAAEYRLTTFLSLPGAPTDTYVYPTGINDDGTIVGQAGNQGFIFAHGATTYVAVAGASLTSLNGIDSVGDIVGFTSVNLLGQTLGFSFIDVQGTLKPIIADGHVASVVNLNSKGKFLEIKDEKGLAVGEVLKSTSSAGDSDYVTAVRHFVVPNAINTLPTAINDQGQIVGSFYDRNGEHSFLLSHGAYSSVDVFPGRNGTFPTGINNHGVIVGSYFDVDKQRTLGFVLDDNVFTTISPPGDPTSTYVTGVGEGGSIVGYYYTGAGNTGSVGFVARPIP